jgi:trehalose 6-phosphate phosphatase
MTLPPALRPFAQHPARAAVLVDFDGSLSPIVDDPAAAVALPAARDALARLVGRLGRVGVISGRSVEFLRREVGLDGIEYVGLYGFERWIDGRVAIDHRVEPWRDQFARAADEAEVALPGLLVERKQGVSLTLHWRQDPSREADVRAEAQRLHEEFGFDAPQRGRMAVELRPPIDLDKGDGVEMLATGFDAVAFAGDDRGDIPAFAAIDRLVAAGSLAHGAKIAVSSPEAPKEVLDAADVVVDGPLGLAALLDQVAGALSV